MKNNNIYKVAFSGLVMGRPEFIDDDGIPLMAFDGDEEIEKSNIERCIKLQEEAVKSATRMKDPNPKMAAIYCFNLAFFYENAERYVDALKLYLKVAKYNPQHKNVQNKIKKITDLLGENYIKFRLEE